MDESSPPLEAFVSAGPEELAALFDGLKQTQDDVLEVRICPLDEGSLQGLRSRVVERLNHTVGSHAWWDAEAFAKWTMEEDSIVSRLTFRDSDDEYLAIAALLDLSSREAHCAIRATDSDGDFLLIDAAESLPEWLDPELSANRVWIFRGAVCVVLDGPRTTIDRKTALMSLAEARDNRAARAATAAVSRRIKFERYSPWRQRSTFEPADALATIRLLALPEKVAAAFAWQPRLVSLAARFAVVEKRTRRARGVKSQRRIALRFSRAMYAWLRHASRDDDDLASQLAAGLWAAAKANTTLHGERLDKIIEHAPPLSTQAEGTFDQDETDLDPAKLDAELDRVTQAFGSRDPGSVANAVDDFINDEPLEDSVRADGVLRILGCTSQEGVDLDSDDEKDDDVQSALEAEQLAHSHMAHSFCRVPGRDEESSPGRLDPLDIDYNVVQSLLDSLQAQSAAGLASSGPAEHLLSQLHTP